MPSASAGDSPLLLIPYGEDALGVLAERILDDHHARLPDLSGVAVLLPDLAAAPGLRERLLAAAQRRGHAALLGPRVQTLRDHVLSQAPAPHPPMSPYARELTLVEALADHLALFGHANPWVLADGLLDLFDALTLNEVTLPGSASGLEARLRRGYRVGGRPLPPLGREAELVHTLWHAWREQLAAEGRVDPPQAYLQALRAPLRPDEPRFYLLDPERLLPAEVHWLERRVRAGRAWILAHGRPDREPGRGLVTALGIAPPPSVRPSSASGAFLEQVFDTDADGLAERARRFAAEHPHSPLRDGLRVFAAADAESHAAAIDLQVRRWLLEGRREIAVVTDDRRLARRVRALLERAGLLLQDSAGWALSTTSAAAALERWLQAVEEDFAHQPLTDVLKSPFVCTAAQREAHLTTVYRLEKDIILRENIARGLDRYRRAVRRRAARLPDWAEASARGIEALLDRLEAASAPLRRCLGESPQPPGRLFAALGESLEHLGLAAGLAEDAAGRRVLEELAAMRASAEERRTTLRWSEFRAWIARALERHNFAPGPGSGPVRLLSPAQARAGRFDALVLGALDAEHLPGPPTDSAFFNDGVRRELGLPTWTQELALRLHRFRRLLEAAPQVLLTYQYEREGEPVAPAPWLEALQTFHEIAHGDRLVDAEIAAWLPQPGARPRPAQALPPPTPPAMPRPAAPAALLPDRISVGRQQQLIDCPYRFFASTCLRLEPPEEIVEALQKADYGERVHLCLQAFHGGAPGLPGPFPQALTERNRGAAVALLEEIAHRVFAKDLEDNFLHRGWLKRWLGLIPAYVDWQIERAAEWAVEQTELGVERELAPALTLTGRIDRLDRGAAGVALIDYKTGSSPSQAEVDSGEAVQLTSYALLLRDVQRVEYVQLGANQRVKTGAALEGDALEALRQAVGARLLRLREALGKGAALPAWGDAQTCRHCEMSGVCRREAWTED